MSKPVAPRRIRVDVLLSGGRIKLDLTDPSDAQLTRITLLLEEWLDDEKHPWQPPAGSTRPAAPRIEPIPGESLPPEQRDLLGQVTRAAPVQPPPAPPKPVMVSKRPLCGVLDGLTGHRCRRSAGHPDDKHAWWGKGGQGHNWTDRAPEPAPNNAQIARTPDPEPDAVALQLGDVAPLGDQLVEHAATVEHLPAPPGVALCRCGHAERMHERDDATDLGRGACFNRVCGCAEYRAAA